VNVGAINQLAWYAANGSAVSGLNTANSSVLITSSGGVPSLSATLPAGITLPQPIIQGVTDGSSAASGVVGQLISSVINFASRVSISNSIVKNITSIPLTAGEWFVWGNYGMNSSSNVTAINGWISSTSATLPDQSLTQAASINVIGSSTFAYPVPSFLFNLSGSGTIYLSTDCAFAGNATAWGGIYALRVR